jgi:LDH2 family malate/lactate/ureidoglycolate dehydrogenase
MSVEEFKRRVDELVRMVKSLPRIKEDQEILLPGEIEWRRKLNQAEGTVKLTEQIFQMLHELSTEYGVNLPEIQVVGS